VSDERADVEVRARAAADEQRWSEALTFAIRGYGEEVLGYLVAMTRNETDANDAFSLFAEDLWKGLPRFRWECTLRTWAYGLARHALARIRRDPHRKRAVPMSDAHLAGLVEEMRSRTQTFLRTETRDKVAKLRAELDPDDQTLLILRLNRKLAWRDIALVLDPDTTAADVEKRAAALRKRFERLKTDLKARAGTSG
jgi:RNA polymerase sigma-70 factor (ECF subfamily)